MTLYIGTLAIAGLPASTLQTMHGDPCAAVRLWQIIPKNITYYSILLFWDSDIMPIILQR